MRSASVAITLSSKSVIATDRREEWMNGRAHLAELSYFFAQT
jgi:hypothetical protein